MMTTRLCLYSDLFLQIPNERVLYPPPPRIDSGRRITHVHGVPVLLQAVVSARHEMMATCGFEVVLRRLSSVVQDGVV